MTATAPDAGLKANHPWRTTDTVLEWGNDVLRLHLVHGPAAPAMLLALTRTDEPAPDLAALRGSALPVVEISLGGDGRHGTAGKRHVDGTASQRLRLTGHEETVDGDVRRLRLDLADDLTGLGVHAYYELADGSPVLRAWSELTARREVVVEYVSSLALSGLAHGAVWERDFAVWRAANPWSGEFRWTRTTLGELGLYDVGMVAYGQVGSKNRVVATSTGAWSTSELLPMGILEDLRTGRMLAWQVEHNGAWHFELGDRYDDVYLAASGPTAAEHQWSARLAPGETFRTVPAAVAIVPGGPAGGLDAVGAAFTGYRRRVRRGHVDNVTLPVVYNDFLNALMADPTTERELPLIAAAAALGAEVYCIDAGWYDDDEDGGWWDSVGAWVPSVNRFPDGGLGGLIQRIRDAGMTAGLWLEPEMVGVRSPVAAALPGAAFFQREGRRVVEWGRYQLDLRHPAARAHVDAVVDRLMAEFDLAYLKLDCNIDIGAGTDAGRGESVGAGLLGHDRALLDWVTGLLDRHPGLTIEGCAAGGGRTDGASGAVFPIQSVTDQQDFRKTPPIAAAAPLAIAPEQAGVWASVEGTMGDEQLAFAVVNSLLSRVHLAGRIDTLDEHQRSIVRAGLEAYRGLREQIPTGLPVWPLGLPGWRDGWLASGLRVGDDLLVAVWRRDGAPQARIPLPAWLGSELQVEVVYPRWGGEVAELATPGGGTRILDVGLPEPYSARLLRLSGRTSA